MLGSTDLNPFRSDSIRRSGKEERLCFKTGASRICNYNADSVNFFEFRLLRSLSPSSTLLGV